MLDYITLRKAHLLIGRLWKNLDHMGATQIDRGVHFAVYSENATRLELLLFDDPNPISLHPVSEAFGGLGYLEYIYRRDRRRTALRIQAGTKLGIF